jgi:hypothetical protein
MSSSRDSFQDGLVARGQITVRGEQGGNFTCTIGSNAHNGTCACTPAATCVQEAACFGALCDYSRLSLAPSTAYKVRRSGATVTAAMRAWLARLCSC